MIISLLNINNCKVSKETYVSKWEVWESLCNLTFKWFYKNCCMKKMHLLRKSLRYILFVYRIESQGTLYIRCVLM